MRKATVPLLLLGLSLGLLVSTPVLAQEAQPTATPAPTATPQGEDSPFAEPSAPTEDSPFDKPPAAVDEPNPFGGEKLPPQPADPFAEATPPTQPIAPVAPAPVAAPADDPFATDQGKMLDPLAKPAAPISPFNESGSPAAPVAAAAPLPVPAAAPVAAAAPAPVMESTALLPYAESLEAALATAKKDGKSVLLIFSGDAVSSENFEKLLAGPEVSAKIMKNFVPVRVDYRTSAELAQKYAVRRQPYAVVINKWGFTAGHVPPTASTRNLLTSLAPFMLKL